MFGNTLGNLLKISSFGESHGAAVGVVLDGFPAGFEIDFEAIQLLLNRRKPGQNELTTSRKEKDEFEIISGVFEGKSTGAPITILIPNLDQKSADYEHLKNVYRPSHADFTYQEKYGIRDYKGGGRSSARITAAWVAAGAIALQYLQKKNIEITAFIQSIGSIDTGLSWPFPNNLKEISSANVLYCPDLKSVELMQAAILKAKEEGDSLGGVITCVIKGAPAGLGEPVFSKLSAELGKAMLSINAVKGFEIGSGFESSRKKGSENNDEFINENGSILTKSNHSGGVLGGISSGMDIWFKTAFKPTGTINKEQETVDMDGNKVSLQAKGRHDPCVVPRAVPIVEALSALVLLDFYLIRKAYS